MNFDYIPSINDVTDKLLAFNEKSFTFDMTGFIKIDKSQYDVKPKTLDDYRNSIFIINMLTQKIVNHQGQLVVYDGLKVQMQELLDDIKLEQKKLK